MGNCMYIATPPTQQLQLQLDALVGSPHLHSASRITPASSAMASIKVLHSQNRHMSEFRVQHGGEVVASMQVAELMLDFPNNFVVQINEDSSGGGWKIDPRPRPMPADAFLIPSHAYLLLPMHRMHCRLPQEEIDLFINALNRSAAYTPAPSTSLAKAPAMKSYHMFISQSNKVTPLNISEPAVAGDEQMEDSDPPCASAGQVKEGMTSATHPGAIMDQARSYISCPQSEVTDQAVLRITKLQWQHQQGSITRPRPWVPKLETISESLLISNCI